MMFSLTFWKHALERAIKTAAQSIIGAGILGEGFDLFTTDVTIFVSFAVSGFVLSVLTSLASLKVGESASPYALSHPE